MLTIAGGILLAGFIVLCLAWLIQAIEDFSEMFEALFYIAFGLVGLGLYNFFGIL